MPMGVNGISSMATRRILAALSAEYQRKTGIELAIEATGGVDAAKRLRAGEAFDVVVLAEDAMKRLAADGVVVPELSVAFAGSPMAMAIPAGGPRPAQLDEAAVKAMVLSARAVGFSTGPSGVHIQNVFKAWNIDQQIAGKIVQAPPGVPVAALIARGEVDLGFQQLSELLDEPGIDILRDLPAAVQSVTTFVAGVCARSANPSAAADAVRALTSRDADGIKYRFGMEPPVADADRPL